MTDNTKYEVTQADRDAAAEVAWKSPRFIHEVRMGQRDDAEVVQAFARHRLTSQPAPGKLESIWIQWSDCGNHIRRWQRTPFDAGEEITALVVPTAPQPDRDGSLENPSGFLPGIKKQREEANPIVAEAMLDKRKAVNNVLAVLLAPIIPNVAERVEKGNAACTAILEALATTTDQPAPGDLVEPSDSERAEWPDATRDYVMGLEAEVSQARDADLYQQGQGEPVERADGRNYLIRKGGYWYRPDCSGYTSSRWEAGRYTEEKARSESHPNGPDGPRDGMEYFHISEVKWPRRPTAPQPDRDGVLREVVSLIQHRIDTYSVAGATLLEWLDEVDRKAMPKRTSLKHQEWASDIACRATFKALREVQELILATTNQSTPDATDMVVTTSHFYRKSVLRKIELEYRWGNLTKVGVVNHLRRGGFNFDAAVRHAERIVPTSTSKPTQSDAAKDKLPIGCVVGTGSGTAMCSRGQPRFGGDCIYPECEALATTTDQSAQSDAVGARMKRAVEDFRWRAMQCRTNPDAFDTKAASVWEAAAEALETKHAV